MSTSHLLDNLELMQAETLALLSTAATLDDASITAPSLCEGWTRAHVVTHIARNADAICNLVHWATTGEPTPMYASPESRDADIAEGARRPAADQVADLVTSAARLAEMAPSLAGAPEDREVEMRGGRVVPGRDLPTLRLREVVFHHVDLDLGYTFADADAGFVERTLRRAVATLADSPAAPSLRLRSEEGDVWSVGDGATYVTGTRAGLLLWLARGRPDGVSSDGSLPPVPPWG
jgi:maleylpyruvate isomerase